jgi:nitrite reductase/ring-hydroxylating ferredoxin subunit
MSERSDKKTRRCFLQEAGLAGACATLLPMLQACEVNEVRGEFEPLPERVEFDVNEAPYDGLSETGSIVGLGDLPILLVRDGQGDILAMGRFCAHQDNDMAVPNSPISGAWNDQNRQLICRFHGTVFSEFGAIVAGPSPLPVRRYRVEFDRGTGKGTVFARELLNG